MTKKVLTILLILSITAVLASCGQKETDTNQNIMQLVQGYQQSVVTFFELKNLQENEMLAIDISDKMFKMEDSHQKLEQISALIDGIKDQQIKKELTTLVEINQERERLILMYLDDIRHDLDYQLKNPETVVDINGYIVRIPNTLMELEYKAEQSGKRLEQLLKD